MFKKKCLALCLILLLTGCSAGETEAGEKFSTQLFAMDTVMDISVYARDGSVLSQAARLVSGLEQALSVTDARSEIARLNQNRSATLSEDAGDLLDKALALCRETGGALDISIYPVVKAWGFTTGTHRIPDGQQLAALLRQVDYQLISYDPQSRCAALPGNVEIDLGSVAKGYTGDRLTALFRREGIGSALLNLGGNVQALGSKPDGSPWKVGIRNPRGTDYLGILSVSDRAVVTSGGYERYFEGPDGEIYWHIMDPATGMPARSGLISATAVAAEGIRSDALSTALFIMGETQATAFWQECQDFQMILVTETGEVLITPGLKDSFQLTGDAPYTLRVIGDDEN